MGDLILVKSGALGDRSVMPALQTDELGYRTDKKELYIGTESGNVRLCGADDVTELLAKIENITVRLDVLEKPSE